MKRRDFLKKSALTLGAIALTGREAVGRGVHEDHPMSGMGHEGMEMKKEEMMMYEPAKWADPNIRISATPSFNG